ncbi:hypothetical protein BSK64_13380 [Paenibacillus odorifer]|uniref:S8 family serine peptidase n=1 Tax=Paenibacillus odorifer TaxID=189426 RepID=UPI00096E250E|nr:S8 family serine peptidase [Paenibacillus odorifer]OME05866.1 hypothetical protein BSK64_13380 [Paenibacillus odorifer]
MKKIKIAVIDSGVNQKDELLLANNIKAIKLENGLCQNCDFDSNGHGTDIIKIICGQTENPYLISIQILNKSNKGSLDALCEAIKYCVEIGVNIINLSLGLRIKVTEKIKKLEEYCNMAVNKGIIIISSNNNEGDIEEESYPFAFNNIIGVHSARGSKKKIEIDHERNNIVFSDDIVSIPDNSKVILRKGNSFLAPIITGLFCEFLQDNTILSKSIRDFYVFLEQLQHNIHKIFFNKNDEQSYYQFNQKRIGYFHTKESSNDLSVINLLSEYSKVTIFNITEGINLINISQLDVFFFGDISKGEIVSYNDLLCDILDLAFSLGINIVMMVPFLSISHRMKIANFHRLSIQSVYK